MTPARLIAGGFGIGWAPAMSGTVASAVATLIGIGLMLLSPYALWPAVLLAVAGGIWAIRAVGAENDPSWVVVDEFAGQWIAMLGLARVTALGVLAAFLLFRVLDITKPGPVGWADRRHDALGVMADDVIAGLIAALVLWAVRLL